MLRNEEPPLEWSTDQVRRVGYEVVDLIAEHLTVGEDGPRLPTSPARRGRQAGYRFRAARRYARA